MNYLAHLLLSRGFPELTTGNLLADFLSAPEQKTLPPWIYKGVLLHRYIDTYADNHPEVKACRDLIRPMQRKYTPVVVDIFLDYFLAYNWTDLAVGSFEVFEDETYDFINLAVTQFPVNTQEKITRMVTARWLSAYVSLPGLSKVFQRMQKHLRFNNQVSHAPEQLLEHFEQLNQHFLIFWPDLAEGVQQKINRLIGN